MALCFASTGVMETLITLKSCPVHTRLSLLQHPISSLVQEIDSIQVEQKALSCVSEKAEWWEGRRALDSRVKVSGVSTAGESQRVYTQRLP